MDGVWRLVVEIGKGMVYRSNSKVQKKRYCRYCIAFTFAPRSRCLFQIANKEKLTQIELEPPGTE